MPRVKQVCLHSSLEKTPYEMIYGEKPDVISLKVFGCRPFCFVEKNYRGKFNPTSKLGVFLSFSD